MSGTDQQPVLAIVKGNPTAQETAAVVTVLFARAAPASEPAPRSVIRSQWASKSRQLRRPLVRGPGAWRASARPG
jgi:acyl-CoA carboxylase epsilon subunit